MAKRSDSLIAGVEATRKMQERAVAEYQDRLMGQLSNAADIFTGKDRDSGVVRTVLSAIHDGLLSTQDFPKGPGSRTIFGWVRHYLAYAGLVIEVDGDDMAETAKEYGEGPLAPESPEPPGNTAG